MTGQQPQPVQYAQPPINPNFVPAGSQPPAQAPMGVPVAYPQAPPPQGGQGYPPQGYPPQQYPPQQYPAQQYPQAQPVHVQPQQQAPAYVISGRNPQWQAQFSHPPPQVNQWTYGMCDCCQDPGLCCDVYWCSPCMLSRLHPAIEDGMNDTFSCGVCALLCGAWLFIGGLACCLHTWYLRDRSRRLFGIRGDACADCCVSCWCGPCAMCQMHREMRSHAVDPGVTCCQSSTPMKLAAVAQPAFIVQK